MGPATHLQGTLESIPVMFGPVGTAMLVQGDLVQARRLEQERVHGAHSVGGGSEAVLGDLQRWLLA